MILDKPEHTLQRGGLTGEKQFKIALSSKIYSILSDKLYTDRIGSVVREICSNAWDGMKMKSLATGQPIEPFRVTLPTDLEPHFIVEDFGVGMPDEQAQELYSTLGLSTKENTNDQIGAFGLGSKSPFAVTDTFTVENTYEGVTYYYLCFKSEDGLPSILPTGKKVEERPNGVKVVIPSSGYNYVAYQKALNRQLIAMEPKPIVTNASNFEFTDPGILSENEFGYILTNATSFGLTGRAIYVKMGMVLYPVDKGQINMMYEESRKLEALSRESCMVLHAPIGALEPLPSREGLSYDTRTIKNIREQYHKFQVKFREQLAEQVSKSPTPIDAYNEVLKIRIATGINLFNENIYVNGWHIHESEHPNIFPTFIHEYTYTPPVKTDSQGNILANQDAPEVRKVIEPQFIYEQYDRSDTRLNIKRATHVLKGMRFSFLNNLLEGRTKFLLWDEEEPKHRIGRMKSLLNDLDNRNTLLVVKVNPLYNGSKTDFKGFIDGLEVMHPGLSGKCASYFSKVPKPDFVRGERRLKDEDAILDGIALQSKYGHEVDVRPSTLDDLIQNGGFEGNACYIKLHRNDCIDYPNVNVSLFKEFSKSADVRLFLVRATGVGKIGILEDAGVVEFKDLINGMMTDYTPSEIYKKRESCLELSGDRNDWFDWPTKGHVEDLINKLNNMKQSLPPFFKLWQEVSDVVKSKVQSDANIVVLNALRSNGLFHLFSEQAWAKNMVVNVRSEFDKAEESLNKSYPLLHTLFQFDKGYANQQVLKNQRHQYVMDYTKYNDLNNQISVSPY